MYKIIRAFLFLFNPETAHNITFKGLKCVKYIPLLNPILRLLFKSNSKKLEREVFGIKFPNPVGLAAGLDKNAELYNELSNLGFGFVEVGSITPERQNGNPKPRCFRLVEDKAIINRMGINNNGVTEILKQIKKNKPKTIIGGNISKGTLTSNENAAKDYERSFTLLYDFVDYFAINVSCPNVKNLTNLQNIDSLRAIIDRLLEIRRYLDNYKPILLKISPDVDQKHLDEIIELILSSGLDGIIATNTTTSRNNLTTDPEQVKHIGEGGLSGAPLFERSLQTVKYISEKTEGNLPIIAVGGIMTPKQAKDMLDAGASLIQIYSGFIYYGPGFIKKILKYISKN